MSRSQPPLRQHLLTRSDLARMGVPAGEILGWLAEGDIEQVGALAGDLGEDPVFTVAPRLRDALSNRLARIGKTAVVLSPLRVRSFLLRSLMHGALPPLENEPPAPPVTSEVPAEALAQHLLSTDLAQVLHEAAADLDADVASMLSLAQEEARLEAARAAAECAMISADEPPSYQPTTEDDEDALVDEDECFDVDDLRELLDGFGDEPEGTSPSSEPNDALDAAPAAESPDDAIEAVPPVSLTPSRNEPNSVADQPPAADLDPEPTMPSTHESHLEAVHEHVSDEGANDGSVDATSAATDPAANVAEAAPPAKSPAEADDHSDLSEAAAVLERLLSDDAPSAPFLEPAEIQSALAALDIDETPPTPRSQPDEPAVETAKGDLDPGIEDPPSELGTVVEREIQAEGTLDETHGEAVAIQSEQAAASDETPNDVETSEQPNVEVEAPPLASVDADTSMAAPEASSERAAARLEAEPEPEVTAAQPSDDRAATASAPAPTENGHEVLGAAMQRVDAFLDRLKAALVEMAARPATPAAAPVLAPASVDVTPLVGAIDGGFAKAVQQSEATAQALSGLAERIDGLGQRLEATSGATMAAMQAAPNARPAAPQFVMPRSNAVPLVLLAVAGLVTAWSVLFWFKTGSPRLALGTLVGANLVGCCLLAARR